MSLNEISDWMTECNFVFQKSIIIVKIWNQYVSLQFGVFGCISAISIFTGFICYSKLNIKYFEEMHLLR